MTDDKDFKRLVRDEARASGRPYTQVRQEMRPPLEPEAAAERCNAIVEAVETHVYGKHDVVRLAALALLAPGNVLLTGGPGNGMTALGMGVAAAIGGHLVSIDGRTGLDPGEPPRWRPEDVVVISHFDGLDPADQVAVIEAGRKPALVLAKRHPMPERMPFPPDDDTRERFLFGADLSYGDAETELRIVNEIRDGSGARPKGAAVQPQDLAGMRAAAAAVDVPAEVRRFAVAVAGATRTDDALLLGASAVAILNLVQATAAATVAAGRSRATIEDAEGLLRPILSHRVVARDEAGFDIDDFIARVSTRARAEVSAGGPAPGGRRSPAR